MWIYCDCEWGWALRKDVKEGWITNCECCGRNWAKLLAKRQKQSGHTDSSSDTSEGWGRNVTWQGSRQVWTEEPWSPPRRPWKPEAPPGLGGGQWMSTQEYQDAVASLWQDADPQAQQVLRACGIEPPSSESDTDPRKVLKRYLTEYKQITQQHRNLMSKKAQLQIKADKIKAQFEKAMQDLADVSKDIEKTEEHLCRVQTQVQERLKDSEPPQVQDLQSLLKNAGVNLSDEQQVALSTYIQTMKKPQEDEDTMGDLGGGWFGEPIAPSMFAEGRFASDNDTSFGPQRAKATQRSNPLSRAERVGDERWEEARRRASSQPQHGVAGTGQGSCYCPCRVS